MLDFDICVCIDEDEHAAIYFSDRIKKIVRGVVELDKDKKQTVAANKLSGIIELMEQTKPHAVSKMLLVEWILAENQWDIAEWKDTCTGLSNLKDENDNDSQ